MSLKDKGGGFLGYSQQLPLPKTGVQGVLKLLHGHEEEMSRLLGGPSSLPPWLGESDFKFFLSCGCLLPQVSIELPGPELPDNVAASIQPRLVTIRRIANASFRRCERDNICPKISASWGG